MNRIPPIKAVMTPFPHSIDIGESLARAKSMMEEHQIRHLPVMHNDRLVGAVTDRDVLLAEEAEGLATIGDLPVQKAYVVELTEPLDKVLGLMAERGFDSALVVKEGRLAGIFTMTDACRCFGQLLRTLFPAGGGNDVA